MAGKIIADIIEAPAGRISLNVANVTVASINASGLYTSTGNLIISQANQIGTAAIVDGAVTTAKIEDGAVTNAKLTLAANASNIKTALNASGDAPIFAARAWVNFSGISTGTIRGSGNVSSITDNGTGRYRINLTTSMPDANYNIMGNCSNRSGGTMFVAINSVAGSLSTLPTVDAFIVVTCTYNSAFDVDYVNVAIFG
jgi:hypothetical protein